MLAVNVQVDSMWFQQGLSAVSESQYHASNQKRAPGIFWGGITLPSYVGIIS